MFQNGILPTTLKYLKGAQKNLLAIHAWTTQLETPHKDFILFYFIFYFLFFFFYFTTQTYIYKHKDMQKFVMKCKTNEKWVAENGFKKMHPTLLTTPRKL